MRSLAFLLLAGWVAAACSLVSPPRTQAAEELHFGVPPYLPADELQFEFQPIVDYISKKTAVKTTLLITKDYADLGMQMAAGKVDIGYFTPFAYVEAAKAGGMELFLGTKYNGSYFYKGAIIVRKDRGITGLAGLKGKSFAFVDKQSASGYVYPRSLLADNGINPDDYFGRYSFEGNHTKVIRAVLAGDFDAGSVSSSALLDERAKGTPIDELLTLAETEPIPQDAIAVRSDLDADLKERVRYGLAEMSYTLEGKAILSKSRYGRGGFGPTTDKDFDVVRKAAGLLQPAG